MDIRTVTNVRCSLDFVSDASTDGRRFLILAVLNDVTRENLALIANTLLSGVCVVRALQALGEQRGYRRTNFPDNGNELTRPAVLNWVQETGIDWHYIQPRKPG